MDTDGHEGTVGFELAAGLDEAEGVGTFEETAGVEEAARLEAVLPAVLSSRRLDGAVLLGAALFELDGAVLFVSFVSFEVELLCGGEDDAFEESVVSGALLLSKKEGASLTTPDAALCSDTVFSCCAQAETHSDNPTQSRPFILFMINFFIPFLLCGCLHSYRKKFILLRMKRKCTKDFLRYQCTQKCKKKKKQRNQEKTSCTRRHFFHNPLKINNFCR